MFTASGIKFREDIEGLRAVAILAVVLFHAGGLLPGGLVGVDLFFVISGFLITSLLLEERRTTGSIDLLSFWARRARRILPSATLVLVCTAAVAAWFVSPLLLKQVGRDIMAAGFFGLNWRAALRAVDYSAPGDDASPVLHYWSLGVEEQFYFVWPLLLSGLLFVVYRSGRQSAGLMMTAVGTLIAVSFFYGLKETDTNQPLAFFSTFSRAWQLLSGALLAMLLASGFVINARILPYLGIAGLVLLLWGFRYIDPEQGFPGWIAALPVLGAVAVILSGVAGSGPVYSLLKTAPLRYIGRISYAWYLWHWPVLFAGEVTFPAAGIWVHIGLLALSFLLAAITHVLVENPVRFNPHLVQSNLRSLLLGLVLALSAVAAGWALTSYALNQSVRLSDGTMLKFEDITNDRSPAYRTDCHISQLEVKHEECRFGAPAAAPEIVLFGDSHAAHFFNPVEAAATEANTAFLMRSKSGCAAVLGPIWNMKFKRQYTECDDWKVSVLREIAQIKPRLVILSSATLQSMMAPGTASPAPEQERPELYREALRRMIAEVLEYADRVVLITDTPRLPEEPLLCLARHAGDEAACEWPLKSVTTGTFYVPSLAEFGDRVLAIDLSPAICPDGACKAVSNGEVIFYDQSHFTATYSLSLKDQFKRMFAFAGIGGGG
jgi:peptidoglycan/LPS O-acetylase OafA/YrhL